MDLKLKWIQKITLSFILNVIFSHQKEKENRVAESKEIPMSKLSEIEKRIKSKKNYDAVRNSGKT